MSKKTLNTANLEKLGTDRLAALVMELVQGSAALQRRRARLELSVAQGPQDVAADIRKRFASLRRSRSFVDWRKQRALVKDLDGLLRMIEDIVAPHDATEAFELLWSFLQLAPSIHERTDDSNGAIGGVMADAMEIIRRLSPRISVARETLAERILDAVAGAGYGEFDSIIPATAEALGDGRPPPCGVSILKGRNLRLRRCSDAHPIRQGTQAEARAEVWVLALCRRIVAAPTGHPPDLRSAATRRP